VTKQLTFQSEIYGYDFRPPQWRPRAQLHTQTGTLLFASILWLTASSTLAARQLARGGDIGAVELSIGGTMAVLGALMLVGWKRVVERWMQSRQRLIWPALSRRALYRLSPAEFEEYVGQRLFARHGYRVENTPESRDGGVDILVADAAGRRAIVQCKRYRGTVGTPAVRDLYGTILHHEADMGYLVTTGKISAAAREWVAGKPLILIDGDRLMRLSRSEPEPPTNSTH